MAQFFNDLFTSATTVDVTSHTSDSGHTWALVKGTVIPKVFTTASALGNGGASTAHSIIRPSVISPTADAKTTAQFHYNTSVFTSIGLIVRMSADGSTGYLASYATADKKWSFYRLDPTPASAVKIAASSVITYVDTNEADIVLSAEGTGATVTLKLTANGTEILRFDDTDPARITAAGYPGLLVQNPSAAGTGAWFNSMSADTIAAAAADTTAPTMTGTLTATNVTPSGYTLDWSGTTRGDNVAITGFETSADGTTWVDAGNITSKAFTGKTASTAYPNYVRAYDAGNNKSTPALQLTVTTAAAPTGTITSNVPDGRIFKHSAAVWSAAATGPIVESGTYSGFTPNQIRLVQDGTNTPLTGFDWVAISTATGGSYAHTFANVPQGVGTGWYNVQFRDSTVPGNIVATGKRGVGIHIGHYGQSQSTNQFDNFPVVGTALVPTGMSRIHGGQVGAGTVWNWAPLDPTKNSAIVAADILLNSLTGGKIPIAHLNMGYPGTSLVRGGPNGNWLPLSGPKYQYGKALIAGLEGSVDVMVDIRGESDANNGTVTQAEFYDGLTQLYNQTRTDCGKPNLPIVEVILGGTTNYWTDAAGESVKKAQVQKAADANVYRVESYDAPLHTDGLHRNTTGDEMVARRWARACAVALGLAAGYRSPRISSVQQVSATVYDATVTHGFGTDYTPASGITGLRVTDGPAGAALTVSTAVHQSASVIRLTLGSTPANLPVVSAAYGKQPATNFADNTALALPLEYSDGVLATAAVGPATQTYTATRNFSFADRVEDTTTTTGTGTVTLSNASVRTFAGAHAVGTKRIPYAIQNDAGTEWETGQGTLLTATTFSRDEVFASSNGGAVVPFSAGTKRVICTLPARAVAQFAVKDYIDVRDFDVDPTFVNDSQAGIQAAILAAFSKNISRIKFPDGRFKLAGARTTGNAHLYVPNSKSSDPSRTILFEGVAPPNFEMQGLARMPITTNGTILESVVQGNAGSALLRGEAGWVGETFGRWNYTNVGFRNMGFRTKVDGGAGGTALANPMSALDLADFAQILELDNIRVDVNLPIFDCPNPVSVNSSAIVIPPVNNHAQLNLGNILVAGFTNGVVFGEHTHVKSLTALGCVNAVVLPLANHGSMISHLLVECCKNSIAYQGNHALAITAYSTEHNTDGNWFDFTSDINYTASSSTRKVVIMQATVVQSHVGINDANFVSNNATCYKVIVGAGAN